jgi:hypothetical protein
LIIGITGPARSGKNTAADILAAEMERDGDREVIQLHFADQMKRILHIIGLSHGQLYGPEKDVCDPRFGTTPRRMLQTLGTDWGRVMIHPDIWVRAMEAKIADTAGYDHHIIPDVRFENEAAMVRSTGVLIHIKGRGGIAGGHVSECGVEELAGDYGVWNTGSLEQFEDDVRLVLADILRGGRP